MPEMVTRPYHSRIFPKIIGRSKSYTENGSAIARSSDRDLDEYTGRHNGFRWMVEAEIAACSEP